MKGMFAYSLINSFTRNISQFDNVLTLIIGAILVVILMFVFAYFSVSYEEKKRMKQNKQIDEAMQYHLEKKDYERLKSAGFSDKEIWELFKNKKNER